MAETPPTVAAEPTVPATTGDTVAAVAPPPAQQTDAAQDGPTDSADAELQPTDDEKDNWNKLDPETRKVVNRAYTKARQRDSAKLKEHPGQQFLDAFNQDPVGTYTLIQAQLKAKGLLKDGDTPKPEQPTLSPQTEETFSKLAEHFGPDAAQLLRQAFTAEVAKEVAPLKQWAGQTAAETSQAKAQAAVSAFEAKNPGWKKYESKMATEAMRITEGGRIPTGMPIEDWLNHLYRAVAFDDLIGAEAQKLVTRMQQSANAEKPTGAVPPSRVSQKPPDRKDFRSDEEWFRAAGEAAAKGISYD